MTETIGHALRRYREKAKVSQTELARLVGASQSAVSRYEKGSAVPDKFVMAQIDDVVNANGALKDMLLSSGGSPIANYELGRLEMGPPANAAYVDGLRATINSLVDLDGFHGGSDLAPIAQRSFKEANGKLACGHYLPKVEKDLEAVTAELGEVLGWLLYDAERQHEARNANLEARELARLAGHRSMELFVLTAMSMQTLHGGRPREALMIARSVLGEAHSSSRVQTLFRLREARALAGLGDRSGALASMAQAESALSNSVHSTDPPWTWWVTQAELAWHAAMMHASLDEWPKAVEWFSRSVELGRPEGIALRGDDHGGHSRRGLYVHTAYLLDALVRVRDWQRAEAVAIEVLPMVGVIGSNRPMTLLRDTTTSARRAKAPSTVADVLAVMGERLAN